MVVGGFVLMFLGVGSFIVAFGGAMTAFRKLVDFQFEKHPEVWLRDGRPGGGKATRAEVSFLGSDVAAILCFQRWLVHRPDWLETGGDGEAYRLRMVRWFGASVISLAAGMSGMILFGRAVIHAA